MERDKPLKIAVDGITASAKTTFSNELAESLSSLGADVHRASLDGFHNPKAIRHRKGCKSPEGYYFDAYNYDAIVRHMLEPLWSGINPKYRTQVFDLQNDQKSLSDEISINSDSIFIVDGSFSLRDELYKYWDFSIYLAVEMSRAQQRAGERDKELFKSAELAIETTRDRYHAAHSIHNKLKKPWKKASIVIDNNDPQNAFLINQSEFKQ